MVAVDVNTTNSTSNIDLEGKESKDDDSHSTTGDFLFCTEWFYLRDSFLSFQQVVLHQNQVILRYCVTVCKQSKCETFLFISTGNTPLEQHSPQPKLG